MSWLRTTQSATEVETWRSRQKTNAYIDAPDGSFPVGEQTWEVWSEGAGRFELGALQLRIVALEKAD